MITCYTYPTGYGMTETSGASHYSAPEDIGHGSVGIVVGGSAWKVGTWWDPWKLYIDISAYGVNEQRIWVALCQNGPREKCRASCKNIKNSWNCANSHLLAFRHANLFTDGYEYGDRLRISDKQVISDKCRADVQARRAFWTKYKWETMIQRHKPCTEHF